jgi:hypothetical protein
LGATARRTHWVQEEMGYVWRWICLLEEPSDYSSSFISLLPCLTTGNTCVPIGYKVKYKLMAVLMIPSPHRQLTISFQLFPPTG